MAEIIGVWISPDRTLITLQLDDETLLQYRPGHRRVEWVEVDVVAHNWVTLIPEHTDGGIDHACCVALEQA